MRSRPRALPAVLGSLAAVVVAAGMAVPAEAVSVNQSYWVPVSEQIVVLGHGFGHGHGMSQYGAQGAALAGQELPADPRLLLPGHHLVDGDAARSGC